VIFLFLMVMPVGAAFEIARDVDVAASLVMRVLRIRA
jgi:hypothetical protein